MRDCAPYGTQSLISSELNFFKLTPRGLGSNPISDDGADPENCGRQEWNGRTELGDAPADKKRREDRGDTPTTDHDPETRRPQRSAEEFAEVRIANTPEPAQHADHDPAENKKGVEIFGSGRNYRAAHHDQRTKDTRRPPADKIGQPCADIREEELYDVEGHGVKDRIDRRHVEFLHHEGCEKHRNTPIAARIGYIEQPADEDPLLGTGD